MNKPISFNVGARPYTLRDKFAMAIMEGELSCSSSNDYDEEFDAEAYENFARWCYSMADLMMKVREE